MQAPPEELVWGQLPLPRRSNILHGAALLAEGDRCAAEFLLFDAAARQVLLCRHADGIPEQTRAQQLRPHPSSPTAEALAGPRQLLLCPRLRIFASLDVQAGVASVALWILSSSLSASSGNSAGNQDFDYKLSSRIDAEGVRSAKALSWLDAEVPPWLAASEAASTLALAQATSEASAVLAILTADEVLVLRISGGLQTEHCQLHAQEVVRLRTGFRASSLCWSADSRQLLVGGQGQMACFTWTGTSAGGGSGAVAASHFLCAGDCVQLSAVYTHGFICMLEQKAQQTAQLPTDLSLPDGTVLQAIPSAGNLVVEVASNPQDAEPAAVATGAAAVPAMEVTDLSRLVSRAAPVASGALQVVPARRFLLPLRHERSAAGSAHLHCGPELEVDGELLAVQHTGPTANAGRHHSAPAVIGVGTIDNPALKVWSLAPPHRWRSSRQTSLGSGPWEQMSVEGLPGLVAPLASGRLQLCGLAIWQGVQDTIRLHAVVTERENRPTLFGTGNSLRTLTHRSTILHQPSAVRSTPLGSAPCRTSRPAQEVATAPVSTALTPQHDGVLEAVAAAAGHPTSNAPASLPSRNHEVAQAASGISALVALTAEDHWQEPIQTSATKGVEVVDSSATASTKRQRADLESAIRELRDEVAGLRADLREAANAAVMLLQAQPQSSRTSCFDGCWKGLWSS